MSEKSGLGFVPRKGEGMTLREANPDATEEQLRGHGTGMGLGESQDVPTEIQIGDRYYRIIEALEWQRIGHNDMWLARNLPHFKVGDCDYWIDIRQPLPSEND